MEKTAPSWPRRIFRFLRLALFVYLGVVLVLMFLENWLVYPAVKATRDWQSPPSPDIEDVYLTCADGVRVHGWWLPCPDAKSALLYLHGNGGNLSWRGNSIVNMRDQFRVSVLIVDYPGYGKSEGRPSEQGCYQTADAAYAWLTDPQHVAAKDILIYGGSLGGGVAVDLASRHDHRALILVKTFTTVPDVGAQLYPWLPARWVMRNRFASIDKITQCKRPVFIAHGDADEIIPFVLGKRLYEAANEPKQFVVMPGATHNQPLPEEVFAAMKTFLAEHAPME
jgi:uncharacterized protein